MEAMEGTRGMTLKLTSTLLSSLGLSEHLVDACWTHTCRNSQVISTYTQYLYSNFLLYVYTMNFIITVNQYRNTLYLII